MKYLVLLAFILTACAPQRAVMDSYMGASKQQILMAWGIPDRTSSDGAGGEILAYAKQIYSPGSPNGIMPPTNMWQYRLFYINSSGFAYHWLVQTQDIPPTQIDLTVYFHP